MQTAVLVTLCLLFLALGTTHSVLLRSKSGQRKVRSIQHLVNQKKQEQTKSQPKTKIETINTATSTKPDGYASSLILLEHFAVKYDCVTGETHVVDILNSVVSKNTIAFDALKTQCKTSLTNIHTELKEIQANASEVRANAEPLSAQIYAADVLAATERKNATVNKYQALVLVERQKVEKATKNHQDAKINSTETTRFLTLEKVTVDAELEFVLTHLQSKKIKYLNHKQSTFDLAKKELNTSITEAKLNLQKGKLKCQNEFTKLNDIINNDKKLIEEIKPLMAKLKGCAQATTSPVTKSTEQAKRLISTKDIKSSISSSSLLLELETECNLANEKLKKIRTISTLFLEEKDGTLIALQANS